MRFCLVMRRKGAPRAQSCMDAFRRALEDTGLDDLGFVGDAFTWRNNWHRVDGYVRERLDRAVANVSWRCLFPLYKIINGDPRHSDHMSVLAELNEQSLMVGDLGGVRTFRFEAAWLQEDDCVKVVEEAWNSACENGSCSVGEAIMGVGQTSAWRVENQN